MAKKEKKTGIKKEIINTPPKKGKVKKTEKMNKNIKPAKAKSIEKKDVVEKVSVVETEKKDKVKKTEKNKNIKPVQTKSIEKKDVVEKVSVVETETEKKIKQSKTTKKDPLTTISVFLGSVKAKHLPDVLFDLMTEKEIQEFAERIEILRQLKKGVTQRVIAKNLSISVTTVSRGSKVLQTGKERIKKYL